MRTKWTKESVKFKKERVRWPVGCRPHQIKVWLNEDE